MAIGRIGPCHGELFADELRSIGRAVARRQAEFSTGRMLARRAMTALDQPAGAILRGEDRAPVWPSGMVGSVSHCRHFAVAGVSHALPAIGLDLECLHRLSPRIHAVVFTESERASLTGDPEATAIFSAKEAVFKAIHPLTQTAAGFLDAEIDLDLAGGRFSVRYVGADGPNLRMAELGGAVAIDTQHVLTVAWLDPLD